VSERARFRPVQPLGLHQTIVHQIEGAIARGDIRPGERLPSERELIEQFGASRPTVRQALRVLEAGAGAVPARGPERPKGDAFLSAGLAKQMTRLAQLEEMSIAELVTFRMILDASASLLAARLRSDDELAAMERTVVVMEEAVERGYDEFREADLAFHDAVADASRNSMIQVCNMVVRGECAEESCSP
jgi:DNA-binding FadR family transcriptional regulator